MSYGSIYLSPAWASFYLTLLKIVLLVVAPPVCQLGLWWRWLAVDRTPSPGHTAHHHGTQGEQGGQGALHGGHHLPGQEHQQEQERDQGQGELSKINVELIQ